MTGTALRVIAAVRLVIVSPAQQPPVRPIAFMTERGIRMVRPDGKEVKLPGWQDGMDLPTWAPDGSRWAYARAGGRREALEVRDWAGTQRTLWTGTTEPGFVCTTRSDTTAVSLWPAFATWAPDGKHVVAFTRRCTAAADFAPMAVSALVFDVDSAKIVARATLAAAPSDPADIRWSPDGRRILVAEQHGLVIDAATGRVDTLYPSPLRAQWTADGSAIYYFSDSTTDTATAGLPPFRLADLYVRSLSAAAPTLALRRDRTPAFGMRGRPGSGFWAPSPDRRRLAAWGLSFSDSLEAESSAVYVYDAPASGPPAFDRPARVLRTAGLVLRGEWSPDGASLAFVMIMKNGFSLRLLDVATGAWRTLAEIEVGEGADVLLMTDVRVLSWTQ